MEKSKEVSETNTEDKEIVEGVDPKNPAHKVVQADGEIGGPSGLEPTRYGDWERKGIISDF